MQKESLQLWWPPTNQYQTRNLDKNGWIRLNKEGRIKSASIRLTISPDSQSQNITKPLPPAPSNFPPCKLSIDQLPEPFIPVLGRSQRFLYIFSLTLPSKIAYEVPKRMRHRFQNFRFTKLEKCRWCIHRRLLLWRIGRWASEVGMWRIFRWSGWEGRRLPSVKEVDGGRGRGLEVSGEDLVVASIN